MVLFKMLLSGRNRPNNFKINLLNYFRFVGGKYEDFCDNDSFETGIRETQFQGKIFKLYYDCDQSSVMMYLHSYSNPCFLITFMKETKELYVGTIQNHKGCIEIFPDHEKDIVDYMIRIIIKIAQKFEVEKMIFQDTSGKSNLKNKYYDLADNYFILHGKTWYDKKMSEYLDDYKIEFHNKNIPLKYSYNELKQNHVKVPYKYFEEITPEFRKDYFKNLGINGITGSDFVVYDIKYKN
jgi:hypothetical protein